MSVAITKVGMKPPRPGRFIREEILDEFGLSVAKAAEILGVRRATLSDLVNGLALAGDGAPGREGIRRVDGYTAPHAGLARQPRHASKSRGDSSATSQHEMRETLAPSMWPNWHWERLKEEKMRTSRIATAVSLFLLASAQGAGAGPYVSVTGGAVFLSDSDLEEEGGPLEIEVEFDTGFGFTGAAGWAWDTVALGTLRTEIEVGYRENDIDEISVNGLEIGASGDMTALSGMANVAFDLTTGTILHPYVMGGLGLANIDLDSDIGSADDTVLAFQVGVGVGIPIANTVTLFGGYRFFGTKDPDLGGIEAEYNSHNVEAGVRVEF